jgi:hypothetical protein
MSADGDILMAHAPYLESALADLDAIIPYIKEGLANFAEFDECDTLVGRGLSGALVVPYVARALGLRWAIARKDNDGSHSSECIEGTIGRRWVFVDDLISSGNTLTKTIISVNVTADKVGYETQFLGAITYAPYIIWSYADVCGRLPEGFDPNARPEPKPAKWPRPDSDITDTLVASLATPQPYDTQDENGNPVYAAPTVTEELSAWVSLPKYSGPDVRGFMIAVQSCPTIDEVYAEQRTMNSTRKPKTPKPPTKRGGKARRALMDLEERMEDQRRALNDKLDLVATNASLNALQRDM